MLMIHQVEPKTNETHFIKNARTVQILNIEKVQPLIYITKTFKWVMYDQGEGKVGTQMDILNAESLQNCNFIQK